MKRRRLFVVLAVVTTACVAGVMVAMTYVSRETVDPPVSRQAAIRFATLWAGLAPVPPSAQNLQVEVKGSIFTREFVITFDASPVEIQKWLIASPGPSSAAKTVAGPITTYAVPPGGGAEFAEVKVNSSVGHVVVRAYWS